MDENNNNNNSNNEQINTQEEFSTENLPKFKCFYEEHPVWSMILVGLCIILGSYLATSWMLAQQIKHAFNPYNEMRKMEKMMQKEHRNLEKLAEQEFDNMEKNLFVPKRFPENNIINLAETENAYIITVDLKNFDNDDDNIDIDMDGDYITISGKNEKNNKNSSNVFNISQSYKFPQAVNFKDMSEESEDGKLYITIPYAKVQKTIK